MATFKRIKSGGSQSEGASNSASPASSVALSNPSSTPGINNNAPKYGTLVPNRIFVGGISSNTTEAELSQLFSKYGNVKATKIIADRAGVSKGYGFVTFETEEEVKFLIQDANNIVLKDRRLNIAPAIKKQPVSLQPFNRSFDASSPPPTTPNLYFHNGVPYTFHNGMAFFPPTPHQPALATLQPSADPSMYQSYGQSQSAAAAHYGTPVLLPAHPPLYMPQNYQYQSLPMTNGAPTQFIYTGGGGSNSGPGSPLGGTPDTPHLPSPMVPHPPFYPHQFPQEAYFHQPFYVSYSYNTNEYESQDQQTNDDCSSTVSTPHSEISDRSSNRSPNVQMRSQYVVFKPKLSHSGSCPDMANKVQSTTEPPPPPNTDSQVPVVSWQNLKNHGEERELLIRDGRRAFHPIVPPRPVPQVLVYQQPQFQNNFAVPNNVYQQQSPMVDNARGQRQSVRGRPRPNVPTSIPFIPKFPASFNNNNPLVLNNNYYDKKPVDISNVRPQRFMNKLRVNGRAGDSPPPPRPNSSPNSNPNSCVTSPSGSPQMQPSSLPPQYETVRYNSVVTGSAPLPPRWSNNPPVNSHQIKRLVCNNNINNNNNNHKRPNGSAPNAGLPNNLGSVRLTKKTQTAQDMEGDLGGGGDAAPQRAQTPPSTGTVSGGDDTVTTGMQTLSLSASS